MCNVTRKPSYPESGEQGTETLRKPSDRPQSPATRSSSHITFPHDPLLSGNEQTEIAVKPFHYQVPMCFFKIRVTKLKDFKNNDFKNQTIQNTTVLTVPRNDELNKCICPSNHYALLSSELSCSMCKMLAIFMIHLKRGQFLIGNTIW